MSKTGTISLTAEDLKGIVASAVTAAVQEVNKPKPLTEAQLAELKQAQQHRLDTAEDYKRQRVNKRWFQEHGCVHEHAKKAGGGTHCVHVIDNDHPADPGYIYCQNCEGKFRPDTEKWRKLDPTAIFDTAIFNKLFQDCAQSQGEMLG
jgi:hypothetical protein